MKLEFSNYCWRVDELENKWGQYGENTAHLGKRWV